MPRPLQELLERDVQRLVVRGAVDGLSFQVVAACHDVDGRAASVASDLLGPPHQREPDSAPAVGRYHVQLRYLGVGQVLPAVWASLIVTPISVDELPFPAF